MKSHVRYLVHKIPSLDRILCQMNLEHTLKIHLYKSHFIINTVSFMPLPFTTSRKNCVGISHLICSKCLYSFFRLSMICLLTFGEEHKLLRSSSLCSFLQSPVNFCFLVPDILLSILLSKRPMQNEGL